MDRKVVNVNFNHASIADEAVKQFDRDLIEALDKASSAGVAPGIITAILQARLHLEVSNMCVNIMDED